MDSHSLKRKALKEELTGWWSTQDEFQTKKALAASLIVHPDTLGDYFGGKKFPKEDTAQTLWQITRIPCLEPGTAIDSSPDIIPHETSPMTLLASPLPSALMAQEPISIGLPISKGDYHSKNNGEVMESPVTRKLFKQDERYKARSIVISLQRTNCPLCGRAIKEFNSCPYCGQHYVWANVPLEDDSVLLGLLGSK